MKIRMLVRALLVALTLFVIVHAYARIMAARRPPPPTGCAAPR